MGKQRKKQHTEPIQTVNSVDWGRVARDLYRRGLIPYTMLGYRRGHREEGDDAR